jgi:hypothetical protein
MDAGGDALVIRLRERAGDPVRRTDARPTLFDQAVGSMPIGELRLGVESAASDLARLVASIQAGSPIDPGLHERAQRVEADMSMPAEAPLPATATATALDLVQSGLGMPLPGFLRRLYLEVADGGFGPGTGLLSADELLAAHRELRSSPPSEAEDDEWPDHLLPLATITDSPFCCLDSSSGRILESDYDEIELDDDVGYRLALREIAPSLEAWLADWLDAAPAPPPPAAMLHDSMIAAARTARAQIAAMTADQRAAMGLPEQGWEQVVWGGIGLEPDQPNDAPRVDDAS